MPIDIRVEDTDLVGFSDPAKDGVKKAGEDFIKNVVAEANRLESGQNSGGGPVEITKAMVDNAAFMQRNAIGSKKTPTLVKVLRISSAIISLVVGFMYDEVKLQNTGYMAIFVLFIAGAILTTTLSTLKE